MAVRNKLSQYGTDGQLFTTDVSAKFKLQSHVTQKLGQISKQSGPIKFRYYAIV